MGQGQQIKALIMSPAKDFWGWKNVPLHTFCPCFRSKSHVPMMKTFPKLGDRSSGMFTSAVKPFSSQTPVLRHEGGLYSVPNCFCHCYCCQHCRGNRVSFDHVFRNFLIINIHVMWWPSSYLSLQAGDMHCGCNKMTHTEAWGDHRTNSLVIWLYSKGAGPRQDPWTEKRIQTFDFWKTLVWGYATVPKTCFLQQSTRKGVR